MTHVDVLWVSGCVTIETSYRNTVRNQELNFGNQTISKSVITKVLAKIVVQGQGFILVCVFIF